MIKGYKSFREGLITQFDTKLEVGKIYRIDSIIKWNSNGYHFCTYPEDTLRYMREFNEPTVVAKVSTEGETYKYDDDYNGYYDMYVTNELQVDKVLSRDELFRLITSRGESSILRMIQTLTLNQIEIDSLSDRSSTINKYLRYYQFNDKDAFTLRKK